MLISQRIISVYYICAICSRAKLRCSSLLLLETEISIQRAIESNWSEVISKEELNYLLPTYVLCLLSAIFLLMHRL